MSGRSIVVVVFLGVLCVLLLGSTLPLQAQAPDEALALEMLPAWEGYVRHSWWTEARVLLRNTGADWRGDLVVHDAQNQVTYRQAVELPAHSYKQYRLPLFVANYATPIIALHDAGGVRQEKRLPTRGIDATDRIVVQIDARGPFVREQVDASDVRIWLPDLASLPETPMAWDVIDVLLLNGIATADLTAAQQTALLAWVAAGGHLIAGGGPALQHTLANLPDALRIAAPGNVRQFTSITVEGGTLDDAAAAPLLLADGATPLATVERSIVAARGQVGQGRVDIVGWDLAYPGGAAWLAQLWTDDPVPAVSAMGNDQAISSGSPNVQTLFKVPFTLIPKFWPWLLLFPLYLFLIGPGTLLLVRRLKRPILAWVFIPAWIFCAIVMLALGLSSAFSQTFPLVHEVALVFIPDATLPARVVQGTAIYAPRVRRLTWTTDGVTRPLSGSYRFDTWYNAGDPFPVEVVRGDDARYPNGGSTLQTRNPLGVITWGVEGIYDSPRIVSTLKLTMHDQSANPRETSSAQVLYITGDVWSETALRDVSLLMGNASYGLTLTEHIPQGATVSISRPVTATHTIHTYSAYGYAPSSFCGQPDGYRPYGLYPSTPPVYGSSPASTCYLTALMDGVPFPAQTAGGVHHQESCLIYTIPCPTQPPGRITVSLEPVTDRVENGWVDFQTNILYAYAPGATLHYRLPAYMQIQEVETLTVALLPATEFGASDPLKAITQISLWNWAKQIWVEYPLSEAEPSPLPIVLTGATARQAFDVREGVRVRLTTRDTVHAKLFLTLEGAP